MPLYEYQCPCGSDFSMHRAIVARDDHAPCPDCGAASRRRIAAPRLAAVGRDTRIAHERNERAAHEPRVHRAGGESGGHTHGPGCGHGHGQAQQARGGPSRPWMLGH